MEPFPEYLFVFSKIESLPKKELMNKNKIKEKGVRIRIRTRTETIE